MNCDDFEAVINDLAKKVIMDADLRDKALSHAALCGRCETRLTDERELTSGLKALAFASAASTIEAPSHVEASLLAAFRGHSAHRAASYVSPRAITSRWLYVAAGIAAMAVITFLLTLTVSRTRDPAQQPKSEQAISPPVAPDKRQEPSVKAEPPTGRETKLAVSGLPKTAAFKRANQRANQGRAQLRANPQDDSTTEAEIATDFFPLMNREALGQLDSGQVVRVELPRSALMSFGLPMNMDRADERIKADVVVGNDGLARAIRFVR
jgi:hypothetical protein